MDWRLELVQVPVTDVDRAKAFYEKAGFIAEHDHRVSDEMRVVQLTPPGSPTSIAIGTGLGQMEPGSVEGLQIVVADIEAAHAELVERGRRGQRGPALRLGLLRLLQGPGRQRLGSAGNPTKELEL
jgi:predicted enzyme related to lactoylglutathione lyase